jgi:hypothetical protein
MKPACTSPFVETDETQVHSTRLLQSRQGRHEFKVSISYRQDRGDARTQDASPSVVTVESVDC